VRNPTRGIALKLAATLAFSLMYVAIKLAGHVPVGETVLFRGLFALLPLFALSFFTHGPRALVRTQRPWLHLRRSVAGTASMFFNFAALARLPLADVTAFSFVMPMFATVLAALLLNEKVGPHRAGAVVLGAVLALSGAFLSAFVVVFIRQMSATETSEAIVFYFMTVCAATGALTMFWDRVPLSAMQVTWLVLCGLLGGIGQVCMTYSYRYAEPSLLAAFDYVAMVWAVALGYFIFAEVPEMMVLAGAGVVIVSGMYIVLRERRLHRAHIAEASLL
jgi:drug/metabolite transporter (DMT)-like permease